MHYWDSSALVALCVDEPETKRLVGIASETGVVTCALSQVEIASAIERRARDGALDDESRALALSGLDTLSQFWTEITGLDVVRDRARRLLAVHTLRAADALQLAAALVAVSDHTNGHVFVCTDRQLADAAAREGFVRG